ncbi:hypothetical protein [Kistimonas asteriae]|uniref:hypothetical protein n=1 Tax=Kistimonas asteriae TaxID=517724 RepID=UPI001BA81C28|nr:hypothetical protein [Kistimonas asteriae]
MNENAKLTISLNPDVLAELEWLVETHQTHGAPTQVGSVEELITHVVSSIADGSRRPGSWERSMLDMMGLISNSPWLEYYRSKYGKPEGAEEV